MESDKSKLNNSFLASKPSPGHGAPLGGKTNGLTNGMGGRTNGMTNGLGGKTNGLTNGMGGRTNGMTNGLGGKTNGLTNGMGNGPGIQYRRLDDRAVSPSRISLAIIIAFIIIVPASFFFLAYEEPVYTGLRVDGSFTDWEGAAVYSDPAANPVPGLDITACSAGRGGTGDKAFLYARTAGPLMASTSVDSVLAFMDSDGDAATGYEVAGIGAEYAAEVYGWNGSVQGRQFGAFAGQDRLNWSAWSWRGMPAAATGAQVEMEIPGIAVPQNREHGIVFMTMRDGEVSETCAAGITIGKGSLVVEQTPLDANGILSGDHVMDLALTARGRAVNITSIQFASSAVPAVAGLPVQVPADQTVTLQVSVPASGIANGTLVTASVSGVTCSGKARITGTGLAAYAHAAPSGIAIDGAFGDWHANVQGMGVDAADAGNPDIDVRSHAAANSTSDAFFYLKVDNAGAVLGGCAAPHAWAKPGQSHGQGNGTGTPGAPTPIPREGGEDVTRVYIDTVAGGQDVEGIAADYLIEITGKNGKVRSSGLYSLSPRVRIADVTAANHGPEMEMGIDLADIGFGGTLEYVIQTTDWSGAVDQALGTGLASLATGTRSSLPGETPAAIITVGPSGADYTLIQDAVDNATAGDSILVWAGTYTENVVVGKQLTIVGNGTGSTVIDGNGAGSGVTITASSVDISGFRVTNGDFVDILLSGATYCRVHNNSVDGTWEGITLESAFNNTVEYNAASCPSWAGIVLRGSGGNIVRNNAVSGNPQGIYLNTSMYNTFLANNVTGNGDGIVLDPGCDHNTVRFNGFDSNTNTAVLIYGADNCEVLENTVANNNNGIYIDSGTGNVVYHNNLAANAIHATDNVSNQWDDGAEGNWWDDYAGTDGDSDGIGDTPYIDIDGGAGAQDNFPLMEPWMPEEAQAGGLAPHDPIRINSDSDFTQANGVVNWATGNGTAWNPWVIAGWEIEGAGSGLGLIVGNTTEHFVIADCLVSNVTGGLSLNQPFDDNAAVLLYYTANGKVINVTARNAWAGFFAYESGNVEFMGCKAEANSGYGFLLQAATSISADACTASGSYYGMHMLGAVMCTVTDSTFTGCTEGLYLNDASGTLVTGNVISSNSRGMWVVSTLTVAVYHNNFLGNTVQAEDSGSHTWDDGTEGNFWSDWTGPDADFDGIVDSPYAIGGGGSSDRYPLKGQDYWDMGVVNPATGNRYADIQDAINDADPGDTIIVANGTFQGGIVVDRQINLVGDGMFNTTIIDAKGGIGIHVTAGGATVSDFKIFNGTDGIFIDGADNVGIDAVNSSFNDFGIRASASSFATISDCITGDNDLHGVSLYATDNATLVNISSKRNVMGINIGSLSKNNTILRCNASMNSIGLNYFNSGWNNATLNFIVSNTAYGIFLDTCHKNIFWRNSIISNAIQAYDTTGTNIWDLGPELGGNYWSDYTGTDGNNDGFGDTPYALTTGQDLYPLIEIPEFDFLILPILAMLGLAFLARKKDVESDDEDQVDTQEEAEDEATGDGPADVEDEGPDDDDSPSEPPKIKHTLLVLGILMLAAGAAGVIGLRLGIVQAVLGDPDAYPGIGAAEPMGHIVSMVPLVLGMVTVAYWGVKMDPIYRELEKAKEEEEEAEQPEEDEVPAEDAEPEEEALPDLDKPEPEPEAPAEDGPVVRKEKFEWEDEKLPEPTIAAKAAPGKDAEISAEAEELFDSIDDLEKAVAEEKRQAKPAPAPQKPARVDEQADKARVERCQKMLSFARILEADKGRLESLIGTGISVHDFTEEIRKAVEKRKKKDEEAARTAEQKASIIEEEVLDELLSLEDEVEQEEEDLEDMILADLDALDKELRNGK